MGALGASPVLCSVRPARQSLAGGLTRRCPGEGATAARDLAGLAGAAVLGVSAVMIGIS